MKIDRVILSCNDNPEYKGFWNPISSVYKNKFGIVPTLVYISNSIPLKTELSSEHGEIIHIKPNKFNGVAWTTTWSLFYATKFFQDEVCLIMGIDQILLSNILIQNVDSVSNGNYTMLISNAYGGDWKVNGRFPTAYHIAKGEVFNKVYNFENDWESEMSKLDTISGLEYHEVEGKKKWGIDESYSPMKLRYFLENGGQISSLNLMNLLSSTRLDRAQKNRDKNGFPVYNDEKLKNGHYSELHSCRPYEKFKLEIDRVISLIPSYV